MSSRRAFTLIELLTVIAIIGLLAALALPVLNGAKSKARRTACSGNLREINRAVLMYSDDATDIAPQSPGTNEVTLGLTGYKKLIRTYAGLNGSSSGPAKLFSCPADIFHYEDLARTPRYVPHGLWEQPASDFSSYTFNGGNEIAGAGLPGIAGRKLSSIKQPSKTVLVAEAAAFCPWSWHRPKRPFGAENARFNDAQNVVSFVDGHVDYLKIYWRASNPPDSLAMQYDPPDGYAYKWSGD